jgi:three-Cys-motif partner protein
VESVSEAAKDQVEASRGPNLCVTNLPFQPDEIGYWSELKLEILGKYGQAYTKAFNNKGAYLKKYYIDGFSGAGVHISKETGKQIEGSPARALKIMPQFDGFYFIDMNANKTQYLQGIRGSRKNVEIHTGDTNPYLKMLLPSIKFSDYKRALCLFDPYGLHLDWEVIKIAGELKTIDMFLNFPIMDINRNVLRHDRSTVAQEDIDRMNRFWGDNSWDAAAYVATKQLNFLDFELEKHKQDNDTIVTAFQERLKKVADFQHVPKPLAMRNKNNAVVYYLFFASANQTGGNIVESIFAQYRLRRS